MSATEKSIQSAYVGSKSMELPMSYLVRIRKHDQIWPELNELGFPDAHSAERKATAAARKILVDAINASRDDIPDRLIVTDGEGRKVGSISLRDVLPKTLR
jgi:hypothetical protein